MASFALFLQCSYYSDLLCLVSAAAESDTAADVVRPVAADVNDSDDDDSSQLGADDTAAALSTRSKWTNDTFVKPCQLLSQLSGYPNLTILYSVFCCLAVSSASAERALSKLKIVKNRLRTSLCDDMLSALLILACEKDLLGALSNASIISRLSVASRSLKTHLQYM